MQKHQEWWRGNVIYHVYPRSFQDSNNDGIGDLAGLSQRLDYIKSLGVSGLWISPFFKSPMHDFGYDVADYKLVDPIFGTNEDFRKLVDRAHSMGLKIIIDLVLSHTSTDHPWFIESRSSQDNPKKDWFIWSDPKQDGTPPNNWLSHFGGSSWEWDAHRGQYYMHNWLKTQADLNLHNKEVQGELLDIVKFWLDFGVDGFRLDVVDYFFHDPKLRDNPPQETSKVKRLEPYFMQQHIYDRDRPEAMPFLQKLRQLTDQYPDIMMVAEISEAGGIEASARYTKGRDLLHTSYSFALLSEPFSPNHVRESVESYLTQAPEGWPSWSFSNHDAVRVATRWGGDHPDGRLIRMINDLLLCLPGTLYVYQGQELGFENTDVPFEKMRDPYSISQYPRGKGRDGCRTPMVWEEKAEGAGFTDNAEPWLPIDTKHRKRAVLVQEQDKMSILNHFRTALKRRNDNNALCLGGIVFLQSDAQILAFDRIATEQSYRCIFNFSATEAAYDGHQIPAYGTLIFEKK